MFTLTNQLHFLITCIGDALNVNVNRTKLLKNTGKCSNLEFLLEELKITRVGETVAWSNSMEGHAQKMRWEISRTDEQKDRVIIQSLKSLHGLDSVVVQSFLAQENMWQSALWSCLTGPDQIKVPMPVSDRFPSGSTLWSPKCVLRA